MMDNALDKEVKVEETEVPYTQVLGESVAEQHTVVERIEDALGKVLMKLKDIDTRLEDFEYRLDNLDSDVTDLRSDLDDFDSSRIENVEIELENLKEALRNV